MAWRRSGVRSPYSPQIEWTDCQGLSLETLRVVGSNPTLPANYREVAQLVEQEKHPFRHLSIQPWS